MKRHLTPWERQDEGGGRRVAPLAVLAYFALAVLFVLDARFFASTVVSITWQGVAILVVLLFGLLLGSRLCRWLLVFFSVLDALGILVIQAAPLAFADAVLAAILLAQAALLCSPAFTVRR
jgi:hypothetical protein